MTTPRRWTEGGSAPGEEAAQRLFEQGAGPVSAPSPEHLEKLWKTAKASSLAGGAAVLSLGGKIGVALVGAGLVAAWMMSGPPKVVVVEPVKVVAEPVAVPIRIPAPVPAPLPVAAPPVPPKRVVPVRAPAVVVEPEVGPPPQPAPPDDATLVVRAAAELSRGDAARAREYLREREERFGRSEHSGPAGLVETEALRQLGRVDEALEELDALERNGLFPTGRLAELPLIRAELLVAAGRCAEAIPLFEKVVGVPSLATRAQAGLTVCDEP